MSKYIGIVLPKKFCSDLELNRLRETFNFDLLPRYDPSMTGQLYPEEQFFDMTNYSNENRAIGCYDSYLVNQEYIQQALPEEPSEFQIWSNRDSIERVKGYEEDSIWWLKTLYTILQQYGVEQIGVCWYFGHEYPFEFQSMKKIRYHLANATSEYLMKIPENTIVFFTL